MESSELLIKIQRMSLGPAGAAHIQSASQPTLEKMNPSGSVQLQSYFEAAMKKYEQDQARIRSAIPAISSGAYIPDV